MAADLTAQPTGRKYAQDPIWLTIETDLITGTAGYFEITIADGGPVATDTLTLTWPGGSIEYEVGSTDASLNWPEQGIATLEVYTAQVAEFLRLREDVGALFDISIEDAPGGVIRITRKVAEAFALSFTDSMTDVAVTKTDGTAVSAEDNLRAYVEVWTYEGDDVAAFNAARRLAAFHSPYDVATAATQLDISAAFAHLAAALPDAATINPASFPLSLPFGEAEGAFQAYLLRIADKYGAPAGAEALYPWGPYYALHGSRSTEASSTGTPTLLHNYRRRDSANFRKPVGVWQPDWAYYMPTTDVDAYVDVIIYWSDGTTSSHEPWDTDTEALEAAHTYWFVAGYRQLGLHNVAPSGGTDADAYIVAYDLRIRSDAPSTLATVRFDVLHDSSWEQYLLFDNGCGGMETVWLRGKSTEGYASTIEEYQRPRRPDHTVERGDFDIFAPGGRPQWEINTGWHDDTFYLEHLRQLPLAAAWLVDRVGRRLRKVIVQAGTLENIREDDQTLYSLKFNIKAGWLDAAANI